LVFIDPVTLKKRAFDPREVKMFSIDSLTFFPKEIKGEKVFMRILINDILKVYLNKHFFTNDINSGSTNEFLCLKPTGESILVSMDSFYPFKTRVGDFFRDDNDLYLKIKKNRYSNKDLFKIAIEYNDWLRDTKK